MLLQPSDFIDKYALTTGMYSTSKLASYIQKYEEQYLVQLLGATLYNEFVSDLSGANPNVPQSPNFLKLFNAFNEDISEYSGNGILYTNTGLYNTNGILQSNGILEMLKGFIYFEFTRDLMNQQTPYGNVKQMAENSIVVDSPHSLMWERYNEGQKTYSTIQEWIWLNAPLQVGQIVLFTFTAGTGYADGTYDLTGGTGSGASVNIVTIAGEVTEVSIETEGINYEVGDVLTIDSGNLDSEVTLTYVGIGNLKTFNGVGKTTAYWI